MPQTYGLYNQVVFFNACCVNRSGLPIYGTTISSGGLGVAGFKTACVVIPNHRGNFADIWHWDSARLTFDYLAQTANPQTDPALADGQAQAILGGIDFTAAAQYPLADEPGVVVSFNYSDIRNPFNAAPILYVFPTDAGVLFSRMGPPSMPTNPRLTPIPIATGTILLAASRWPVGAANGILGSSPPPGQQYALAYVKTRGFIPDAYNAIVGGVIRSAGYFQMKFTMTDLVGTDTDVTSLFPPLPQPPGLMAANWPDFVFGVNLGYLWSLLLTESDFGPAQVAGGGVIYYS